MSAQKGGRHRRKADVVPLPPRTGKLQITPQAALAEMHEYLQAQTHLCCVLESFADRLPDNLDSQECLHAARTIYPIVKRAHEFEEGKLFPLLQQRFAHDSSLNDAIHRLRFEHWEDESYAAEVADGLISFVRDRHQANTEALGYMLRGFFEGLRRHLAFEREHICPMLSNLNGGHATI